MISIRHLLLAALLASFPATGSAAEEALATRFTLLVGFPSSESAVGGAALLVPGSVIPLGADPSVGDVDFPQKVEETLSFAKAVEKLWATFRLDPARQFEKGKLVYMAAGKSEELPALPDAGIRIDATMRTFSTGAALFNIVMRQEGKPIADSTVSVTRGGRAVVGGLGGDRAPYVFVIIEPEDVARNARTAKWLSRSSGFTAPRALVKVPPGYPEDAKKNKVSGVVVLQLQVGTDGRVEDVKVLEYPDPALSKAAVEAVRQWRFEPARLDNGTVVSAFCSITFNFQLR